MIGFVITVLLELFVNYVLTVYAYDYDLSDVKYLKIVLVVLLHLSVVYAIFDLNLIDFDSVHILFSLSAIQIHYVPLLHHKIEYRYRSIHLLL